MKKYQNKYFSILGDSISTLFGYTPPIDNCFYTYQTMIEIGLSGYKDTWWGRVIESLGGTLLVNNSIGGSLVAKQPESIIEVCACSDYRTGKLNRDEISPDVIMIYMGTNDCGWRVKLEGAREDVSCFRGAYGTMLEKLKRNYPKAEIWCLTLCRREGIDGGYMKPYCDIIGDCAKEYGCKLIDLYNLPRHYESMDGLHPNAEGMKTIAEGVLELV